MKRILLFINSLSSGGAEHQLSILANLLTNHNFDVTVVTISNTPSHYFLNNKVKHISIGSYKYNISKLLSIWIYFLTVDTDCIISFCQRNNFFVLPPLFLRSRKRVKVICGERNFTIGKQGLIEKILFNYFYKRADFIVPNSYSQGSYIKAIAPWLDRKIVPITNFTSLVTYKFSEQPQNSPVKIGVFCRYEKQKNCLGFLEAVSLVKKQCKIEFQIHWYGNKNFSNPDLQKYYDRLNLLLVDYNLQNVVFLNDAIKDVAGMMSKYDAICLPSFFEGFSNTISEAICCGRPVICSDVSDNSLMVRNNENGFLFNPNDIDSMVRALTSFFALSYEDRVSMGKKSREIAENLFNEHLFVNSYINLINQ